MTESFIYIFSLIIIFYFSLDMTLFWRKIIAYVLFFITPLLSVFGYISPLTGFDSRESDLFWGISFLTPVLSYHLIKYNKANKKPLLFSVANPIYMLSGPFPVYGKIIIPKKNSYFLKRAIILQRYFIMGFFFVFVVAPGFQSLLAIKENTDALSTLLFGLIFEFYVYFNFAGFTFIAWSLMSLMSLMGMRLPINFKEPFSSKSVVDYWRRWHISLSFILKLLFFTPLKITSSIWIGVISTFMASAIWHGVTINFLAWGAFHSLCWTLSRQMYLKKVHGFFQIILLLFTIIIGRVIFSESDSSILLEKITSIFTFKFYLSSFEETKALFNSIGKLHALEILIGLLLIGLEATQGRKKLRKHYAFLLNPNMSTLMLLIIILTYNYNPLTAVYGAR